MRRAAPVAWLFALLVLAATAPGRVAADTLEAFPLKHRLAEELVPALRPLLPAEAGLGGTGDVLLVRGDAATMAQVRAALEQLDRAPRQLLITLGQSTDAADRGGGVRASGSVSTASRPDAPEAHAGVAVRAQSTRADVESVSSVRALEGHEAFVAAGESRTSRTTVSGTREALTGFRVTPRVAGDQVTLEISPVQAQFRDDARGAPVAERGLTTTVRGRLGEWIDLGGIDDARAGTQGELLGWSTRSALTHYSAWVKVDEVR